MKINYPDNIKKGNKEKIKTYSNRGMILEDDINETNNYYLKKDIAVIYKKPTPIQIVKTKDKKITEAYFKLPSTTDYNGLYKGKYIDFEAKETTLKTNFPLKNIHSHQINHIKKVLEHGGCCFLIVRFVNLNKTYLLYGIDFINFISNEKRQSIPINYFKEKGFEVKLGLNPRLDYIKILEDTGGTI